jgi:hypothetical protein
MERGCSCSIIAFKSYEFSPHEAFLDTFKRLPGLHGDRALEWEMSGRLLMGFDLDYSVAIGSGDIEEACFGF